METPQERQERIRRLETARAERRAGTTIWPTPDDAGTGVIPVEIAPGRGNLNNSSNWFVPSFPTALSVVGGRTVSFARLFQSQPWVAAAIMRMLTWSVRVPLKVYRITGESGSRERLGPKDHPLAAAVRDPWNRGNMAQLIMNLLGPILVHGNSVTLVDEGAGGSIQFVPKDWRYCQPIMPFRDSIDGFTFDTDSPVYKREYSVDEVLHLAWWSPTGPIGTSPLMQLGVTLNIEDAAQRHQRAQLLNSARSPLAVAASEAFLEIDRPDRDRLMAQLRADLTAIYTGPENSGRPFLMPPGLTPTPIGFNSQEAELIEQRKITREEIAGVYLIPPPMLGILDKATFSNIDTQRDMVYTDCLGPPLVLIEQAINSQVISALLREDDVYVEFDFGGVLRGNRLDEIQAIREAVATAVMTPNEGRDVLNRPRSDNSAMDEFYMPTNNIQPIGTPPRTPVQIPVGNDSGPSPAPGTKRLHVRSRDFDGAVALA